MSQQDFDAVQALIHEHGPDEAAAIIAARQTRAPRITHCPPRPARSVFEWNDCTARPLSGPGVVTFGAGHHRTVGPSNRGN
jgi:hypothetical protein